MARLREQDLKAILGPDYARKMQSDMEQDAPTTPAEEAAARKRKADKLAELRFSLVTLVAIGFALLFSSYYTNAGLDLQAICAAGAVLVGVVGLFVATTKRRALLAPRPEGATVAA